MTTALQLRDKAADIIAADSALTAWCAANFSSGLTIKKGFIRLADIREEWFPAVIVAAGDESLNDDKQTWSLDLLITCGVDRADTNPDQAEQKILELSRQVCDIFDADPAARLDGLAVVAFPTRVSTDAGSQIPKLYRNINLKVTYER